MKGSNENAEANTAPDWLIGGGDMGELIRSMDFSGTPLGPRANWPQTLQVITNVALSSTFPMAILWGEELLLIYNDAYRVIAGRKHPDAVGRPTRDVWPEVWDFNRSIFEKVMQLGQTIHLEDQLLRINRNGYPEDAYFTLSYSPIRLENGRVGGTLVALIETTWRILAERALRNSRDELEKLVAMKTADLQRQSEELRKSNERERQRAADFKALFETVPATVWVSYDPECRNMVGNSKTSELRKLLSGRNFSISSFEDGRPASYRPYHHGQLIPPEDMPMQTAARTGQNVQNSELEFRFADGRSVWLYGNAVPLREENGFVRGAIGAFVDITERKRMELETQELLAKVREERDRLFALIASIQDEVWFCDTEKNFTLANPSAFREFGIKDMKGVDVERLAASLEVYRPDGSPRPVEETPPLRALNGEVVTNVEEIIRTPSSGELRYRQVSAAPVRDAGGNIIGSVSVVHDITERKQAETRQQADLAALSRIHALSGKLLGLGGTQSLLQEVMDEAIAIVKAEKGTLQLLEGDSLRIVAHHGHRSAFLEFFASAESSASVCGLALDSGERVVVPDVEASSIFAGTPSLAVLREAGVRAVQSTPMISRKGALLGVITTQWGEPYTPDEHDLWRIDLLTRQAADLVERTQAEEALREGERRERERAAELTTLLDLVPVPVIIVHDQDGVHMTGNLAADELLRRPRGMEVSLSAPEEKKPTHFRAFKEGRELRTDELPAQRAARGISVRDFDFSLVFDDETTRHVVGHGTPLLDEQGQARGAVHVLVDMTGRMQMETELRESERNLKTVQRIAHLGFWVWDIDRDILEWSEETYRMLGVRPGELRPNYEAFLRFAHPDDRELLDGAVKEGLAGIRRFDIEWRHLRGDGSIRHMHSQGDVEKENGRPARMIGTVFDVTERRQMEEAMRRSRDELEQRVRERTAELERKNQELQEFAFVASHDLAEPLRKIQAFGSLLSTKKADRLGNQGKDYISRMTSAANRMQDLLEALLKYSRVETKGENLKLTNLNDVVKSAASDLEILINEAGARIEIGALPSVNGDSTQLRQLFQNLIGNAVKYRRQGLEPCIRIYGEKKDGKVRAFVEDNGVGFDEQYLGKIFQPFQRLHGRSECPGIGMGLAICRKIVERHQGTITAKSSPGKGATFIITLPVEQWGK